MGRILGIHHDNSQRPEIILVHGIKTHGSITGDNCQLKNLWVPFISEHGERVARLPAIDQDGVLGFTTGAQPEYVPSTMVYLIRL
jgi:hypothetical protein